MTQITKWWGGQPQIVNLGRLDQMSLDENFAEMIRVAIAARKNSQAPYSKFGVGAAVESESGKVYAGCNVERCSYSQTTHAEQNVIDSMVTTEGSVRIRRLFLVGALLDVDVPILDHDIVHKPVVLCPCNNELVWPCGHCRQIVWENCDGVILTPVYTLSKSGDLFLAHIGDLYPFPFGPQNIGIKYRDEGGQNG
ncbi:MAG: hypothetical protein HY225_03435 [Candidatus Vogelbacteria bacterium]|nr:hypothetical protein [Candidatus Vogelbacteria bacterium]